MESYDNCKDKNYEYEVAERWGKTNAYTEYTERTKNYSPDKWENITDGLNSILAEFALCMKSGEDSHSDTVRELVKKLQQFITENYYTCTDEILAGLGQMYVQDERFRKNIDKHEKGTADFVSNAIEFYCSNV